MSLRDRIKAFFGRGSVVSGLELFRQTSLNEPTFDRPYSPDDGLRTYVGAIFACARGNAQLIAGSQWHVARPATEGARSMPVTLQRRMKRRIKGIEFGDDHELIDDPDHPLIDLLRQPNEWQTWTDFLFTATLHAQLADSAFILVEPGQAAGGEPVRLTLLNPARTRPVAHPTMPGLSHYEYRPQQRGSQVLRFAPVDVLQFRTPAPDTPFLGFSPCRAAWDAVRTHINKHIQDRALLRNMARPDFIALLKGASKDAIDRFAEEWRGQFQGSTNTGKMAAVNAEAIDVKTLGEFGDRPFGVPIEVLREIAAAFQYPLQRLVGNDPVKANSEIADESWRSDMMMWATHLEEALRPVVRRFGEELILFVEPLTRSEARQERSDVMEEFREGIITIREARVRLGHEADPPPELADDPAPAPPPPPTNGRALWLHRRKDEVIEPSPTDTCVMRELNRLMDAGEIDLDDEDAFIERLAEIIVACRTNGQRCGHYLLRATAPLGAIRHKGAPATSIRAGIGGLTRLKNLLADAVGVPEWALRPPPVHFDGAGNPNCRCFIDALGIWNVIQDDRTCPFCPTLAQAWNAAVLAAITATVVAVQDDASSENQS